MGERVLESITHVTDVESIQGPKVRRMVNNRSGSDWRILHTFVLTGTKCRCEIHGTINVAKLVSRL